MAGKRLRTSRHDVHEFDLEASLSSLVRRSELLQEVGGIARMMTSTQDIDTVMRDILERTRRLAESDMAYVALNRGHETFIRYSLGIRTEGYRNIRMPLGTGVLGRAATGREPVITADYLQDRALLHLSDIDKRVQGEGVRSILGVPMTLHGVVHGALLIADRSEIEYTADTLAALETLALHTAVALEYAARLDEVTAALDRLNTRHDLEAERVVDLQEVLNLEGRLLESIMRGDDPTAVARTVQDLLGAAVTVMDESETPPAPMARAVRTARHSGHPTVANGMTVACALGGGEHLATLLVHAELPEGLHPRLQRIATFLGLAVLMERAQKDETARRERTLLDTLLGSLDRTPETARAIDDLGISAERPFRMLSMSFEQPQDAESGDFAESLQKLKDALNTAERSVVARHQDHICALIPDDAWTRSVRKRCEGLVAAESTVSQNMRLTAGISKAFSDPSSARHAHKEAERARSMLKVLGVAGRIADGEGLGAVGILTEALAHRPDAESPLQHIEPLKQYDAEHGTELLHTAWVVAESGGRVGRCASKLHVHENTVRQRMERISAVLGSDWREPARFLDIHIALRMWALAHSS